MKETRFFLLILLLFAQQLIYTQEVKIKVIETSDVHGALFPFNFVADRPTNGSLAQVLTYVNQQRADTSQSVVLLDNGDLLQGTPAAYYYNYLKTDTIHLFADAMNRLGYDAATVGNHDIETGHAVYDKFRNELNFPWLAANALRKGTDEPYFAPYHIMKREGVTIAVLGLVTPLIPEWLPEKLYSGMEFDDMVDAAKRWVQIIREKEHPDLLIGLFHSGVDYTYGGTDANTHRNENAASLVAKRVAGFDAVFVGHDHKGWNFTVNDPEGREVLILGTTSGARNVAVAELVLQFDPTQKRFVKGKASGYLIDTKNFMPDSGFLAHYAGCYYKIREYVSQPVAHFDQAIISRDALFGPSKFTDLIHRVQLELTHADLSFTSPLSFNARINEGVIRIRDLFDLYSFENQLYTISLSGNEIKDYLEYSYGNWFSQMKSENDHLLRFGLDSRGEIIYGERTKSPELVERYYNFESAAGIDYEVDVTQPAGHRVTIHGFSDGKPFNLDDRYSVAINSYRANGGGGHLTYGAGIPHDSLKGRVLTTSEKDLRFYLTQWLEQQQIIRPHLLNNWKVVPENFWKEGKERDSILLFGK